MRNWLGAIAAAGLSLLAIGCTVQAEPNIVVIMTDDQNDVGQFELMPKTKALLVNKGVRFVNSFVDYPLCCPSRASLLTGQSARNHHVVGNTPPDGGYSVLRPREDETLGVWLQKAGYVTAVYGKVLNGVGEDGPDKLRMLPGWNDYAVAVEPTMHCYYNCTFNVNGTLKKLGDQEADYSTDFLTSKAVEFINDMDGQSEPFFLLVTPTAPHKGGGDDDEEAKEATPADRHLGAYKSLPLPMNPAFNEVDASDKPSWIIKKPLTPEKIADYTTEFRSRQEALLAVDDMVETIVNTLTANGQLDKTIIIYTSDNGYLLGEHRLHGKRHPYENSIRVPLVIRLPGVTGPQTRDELVNNLDVVSTILDFARATASNPLDGKTLKSLLSSAATPWRSTLLFMGGRDNFSQRHYYAVRTTDSVYIEHNTGEREFYNLKADPYQLENKGSDPSSQVKVNQLDSLLSQLKSCVGSQDCWTTK